MKSITGSIGSIVSIVLRVSVTSHVSSSPPSGHEDDVHEGVRGAAPTRVAVKRIPPVDIAGFDERIHPMVASVIPTMSDRLPEADTSPVWDRCGRDRSDARNRVSRASGEVMDAPDIDTVEAFTRGDPRASDQVLAYTYTCALRTASAVLLNRRDAADIAQEAAATAWRQRGTLRDPERLEAWVYRITVRAAWRALAARRRRESHELDSADAADVDPVDPVAQLVARDGLRPALARLSARQRIALALRYVADLREEEVARAMNCRPGTAAALLSRARATLRDAPELAEWNPDLEEEDDAPRAAPAS